MSVKLSQTDVTRMLQKDAWQRRGLHSSGIHETLVSSSKVHTIISALEICNMKHHSLAFSLLAASAAAYTPNPIPTEAQPFSVESEPTPEPEPSIMRSNGAENLPGAVAPLGFFDPLGLSVKADGNTLKRYREAELHHGRVSMLAVVGILASESVVKGPAITHLDQTPKALWVILLFTVAFVEIVRAQIGWVDPEDVPFDQPGMLRSGYVPGDLGFDPLGFAPQDALEFKVMQTKELQNGRLAMIAAAGAMVQEVVDKKGIIEHLTS